MVVGVERVEGAQEVVEEGLVEGEGAVLEVGWVEEGKEAQEEVEVQEVGMAALWEVEGGWGEVRVD